MTEFCAKLQNLPLDIEFCNFVSCAKTVIGLLEDELLSPETTIVKQQNFRRFWWLNCHVHCSLHNAITVASCHVVTLEFPTGMKFPPDMLQFPPRESLPSLSTRALCPIFTDSVRMHIAFNALKQLVWHRACLNHLTK